MMDIKILVTVHKKCWMPKDPVYWPIHVGAEGKSPLEMGGCTYQTTQVIPFPTRIPVIASSREFIGHGKI